MNLCQAMCRNNKNCRWKAKYEGYCKIHAKNHLNKKLEENKSKGSQCSVSGNNYEKKIYNVVKQCSIHGKEFNTQKEEELAGSSSKNDIECNFINDKDIGIEIKKSKTPDWMQCSIKYNNETKRWKGSTNSKIPIQSKDIFDKLLRDINLFNGEIPPFIENEITHKEWLKIKKDTNKWNDIYIDISPDIIRKLYQCKGCKYIQISDGYGLYHLGEDTCNFGVPLFDIKQKLRIRTKIHTRKNKKGFCDLSVTASCKPENINSLIYSTYSLDDKDRLPNILLWNSNFNQ